MSQLLENRDDLMQIYVTLRHKINEIAYKLIAFIEDNHVDRNSMYFLEYTMDQMLRKCKSAVPHNKHINVLSGLKTPSYLFLHQGEYSRWYWQKTWRHDCVEWKRKSSLLLLILIWTLTKLPSITTICWRHVLLSPLFFYFFTDFSISYTYINLVQYGP